jgi:hypothetical protein
LFEFDRTTLNEYIGLRIRLPGSVEAVDPIAESSKEGGERGKRERKAKGKGKETEKPNDEGREGIERGMTEFDERAARRAKLWELRIRKSVEMEVLKNEIESIDKMLEI